MKTYSGGQRRRLDVALGIVHEPEVLFLDEPSTGLDPQNRANLWEHVRALREHGTTVFLTTHYLEEADALCDRLMIIDHGEIVSRARRGISSDEVAGDAVVLSLHDERQATRASAIARRSASRTSARSPSKATSCGSTSRTAAPPSRSCCGCSTASGSASGRSACPSPRSTTSSCDRPDDRCGTPALNGTEVAA